jgi:hypothetical protein
MKVRTTFDHAACVKAVYREGYVHLSYSDGEKISFPVAINRRLRGQPPEKLKEIRIGHFGISWPALDEDLSHAGIRSGRFGQA